MSGSGNIQHTRVVKHSVQHQVRWDYLVLGLVAGYAVLKLFGGIGRSHGNDGHSVEVERTGGDTVKGLTGGVSGN